jgi:biopolymer transport protein ExbB/TolQ
MKPKNLFKSKTFWMQVLSIAAAVSGGPFLGLLGTVSGMILAFREVAVSSGSAGAGQLAGGIYSALVTTVAGLLIEIPALGAFAVLRNTVLDFSLSIPHKSVFSVQT